MTTLSRAFPDAAPGILGVVSVLVLTVTFCNLLRRLFSNASLPTNLPWAGLGQRAGRLGKARANLLSFFNLKDLLDEGYSNLTISVKYSKRDKTYVLPYYINGPQVILPPSQIPWLLEQPDDVLNQEQVNRQFLQAEYAFMHANLVKDPVHPEIIHRELTKKINNFADDIVEEINASLEDNWGSDTEEWREVKVYDTMLDVVARLSIRVLMGLPLCRNKVFLSICSNFIRQVALAAAAISLFPDFLKPLVGPVFTLYDRVLYMRCRGFLMPVISERLDLLRDPDIAKTPEDATPPNNYVQWSIDHALAKSVIDPIELDPRVIASRFSVLAFAAIQSSVITLTNTLFDLAASPNCISWLASMREEVIRETEGSGITAVGAGQLGWTRNILSRMTLVDSALRESLRLNGFIERGIMKMVVAPEGVTLPDGSHIPCGTKVGISGYSVHHDEANYPNAMQYDAFRFAHDESEDKKPQGLINTSEKFMGFSHGSHACPGRFFATNQLKIALGHIALLYEIEPIPDRPVNKWFFGHIAPPLMETLRVRRRKTQLSAEGICN
ncbi:cytochrome P450 [Xylariaceae sp. FL1019]|nr:cytochrome P450 [Xylariaceae sp. FL1019]